MYRIEVKPGEETIFRTIEELATGIRNGFITPRAPARTIETTPILCACCLTFT